jgi:hypothetical protein
MSRTKAIPSNDDSTKNTKPLMNFTLTEYIPLVPTLLRRLTMISTDANAAKIAPEIMFADEKFISSFFSAVYMSK